MKKLLLALVLTLIATACYAGNSETITLTTNGVSQFTTGLINDPSAPATQAVCTLETNNIRFWTTGKRPSASSGMLMNAGGYNAPLVINGTANLNGFRGIAIGGNATLQCSYY